MTDTKSQPGTSDDAELYRVRDIIASHISCEADCQARQNGCGCAMTAAREIVDARCGVQITDERIAQLQYEAGMYKSLYENATAPRGDNWTPEQACQLCGEIAPLRCGPSRFGDKTLACDSCWNPQERT